MKVLVTGASGLIGQAVCARGAALGWHLVRLRRARAGASAHGGAVVEGGSSLAPGSDPIWDPVAGCIDWAGAGPFEAVIHLAGETVAQRWSAAARQRIYESRVQGTETLGQALGTLAAPPKVVVCASATGFYGDRGEDWVDEDSSPGTGFLADVCREWEAAAERTMGGMTRLVRLRFGLVLAPRGGALARMLPVFRLGLGGRLGDGRQFWSWITLDDLVRLIEGVVLDERYRGVINAVSPAPVTNAEFTRALGRTLHRPAIFPVPRLAVLAAFGEMGREALLAGVRVRPQKLLDAGFQFQQPELVGALKALLASGSASEKQ